MYLEVIKNIVAEVGFEALGVVLGVALLICVIQTVRYSGVGRDE